MAESAAAAPVPDKGLLARVIGIITSPGETFRVVVQNPRPAGILFICCVVLAFAVGLPQFSEQGRQAALDMQVQNQERFTGQPVTPEQYQRMEQFSAYTAYFTIGSIFVFVPIMTLVFTAIYWAVFNAILGGTATFKQVLGVVTHSQVVTALGAIIGAPIQYVQGTITNAGPFNLGALAPMLEPNTFFANFLGSISVFQVWGIVVTAIGLGTLYRRKSSNIALTLLVLFLLVIAAVAYIPTLIAG